MYTHRKDKHNLKLLMTQIKSAKANKPCKSKAACTRVAYTPAEISSARVVLERLQRKTVRIDPIEISSIWEVKTRVSIYG